MSVWLPWGAGAGMGLISFLFCIAHIVVAMLLVILTPTMSIGAGAGSWVAYGILIILCLVVSDSCYQGHQSCCVHSWLGRL
ncbi:hypothetical protein BDR06DRAFT_243240 [Suillus hirtellus]|nr:hypothetical protein BDR06DRAFT_243240 [Suillus hirtellus]